MLVRQVRTQLKKIAVTDKARVDTMFLRYNKDRQGFIGVEDMRALCRSLQLPVDDDVIVEVSLLRYFFFDFCSLLQYMLE